MYCFFSESKGISKGSAWSYVFSAKFYKTLVASFPNLRPILLAIHIATYGWAQLLVPLLRYSTLNDDTINSIQDGEAKGSPASFSPVTSTNVGINQPPTFSDFQYKPFCHTGVKFQGYAQCQPQIIELETRQPLK